MEPSEEDKLRRSRCADVSFTAIAASQEVREGTLRRAAIIIERVTPARIIKLPLESFLYANLLISIIYVTNGISDLSMNVLPLAILSVMTLEAMPQVTSSCDHTSTPPADTPTAVPISKTQ